MRALAAKTLPVQRIATGKNNNARKSGALKVTTEAATWSTIDHTNKSALAEPSFKL
ncbi:hypothetical protein NTGHW29_280083 [Candidatus Nitrotoga sp. HW29]|nr:hypothetical protein NTGHW29_280083 [Candidatus Nitrotoga sp. HW29]